ncbi:hypothetical protein ACFOW6_04305 [Fodinicurvata halophila]|uniref:Uncharacterized protein n=1 Tax=Fodinicurvata halophila TaxID=1419723 RepID=A0ABV8UHV9_9PROT
MVKSYSLFCTILILLTPLPVAAKDLDLTITRQDCRLLQPYEAEAGQDPAYKPGEDVDGNPVAPADLNGGTGFRIPDSFSFPLEVTPFPDSAFSSSAIRLGRIRVGSDGRVFWNGKSLSERDRYLVAQECRKNSK